MKHRIVGTGVALLVGVALLNGACRQDVPVALSTEANLRAMIEGSRRAQPPETKAAAKIDLAAAETETMNPEKHLYTVDPSVEYADLTIRMRPFTQLKGKILNAPAPNQD